MSEDSKWRVRVAAGILPAVESGILPPGPGVDLPSDFVPEMPTPPGGTPGSTAGRMPSATFFAHARSSASSHHEAERDFSARSIGLFARGAGRIPPSGWLHALAAVVFAFQCCASVYADEKRSGENRAIPVARIKHPAPVDFEREILPILKNNCLACHNKTTAKARLILETPQAMLQGGDSGPAGVRPVIGGTRPDQTLD